MKLKDFFTSLKEREKKKHVHIFLLEINRYINENEKLMIY